MKWTAPLFLVARLAVAQVTTIGDVIVVPDATGSIHQRLGSIAIGLTPAQGLACQDAARAALGTLPDAYDFLAVFLSEPISGPANVPFFQQARVTAQNIGQNPLLNDGTPFGSRAQLKGCIFMGSIQRLPADPDALAPNLGSAVTGMTGMEALGHEFGHAWLVGADYDVGFGKQEDLRSGDRHYQARVDSRSVMFGGCIDPLGGGDYRVKPCARGYNSMDLYFMGLAPPSAVQPLLLVLGQGSNDPPYPLPPGASPVTISGSERRVGVDAVIRQMGQRSPAYPATQRCFRTGFVYVSRNAVNPASVVTVDAYRRRFETWFSAATNGSGSIDTRAIGTGCVVPSLDAGVPDAGPSDDAGVDAGVQDTDAGLPSDGGTPSDAGSGPPPERVENQQVRPLGCGCQHLPTAVVVLALMLPWARRRRAR